MIAPLLTIKGRIEPVRFGLNLGVREGLYSDPHGAAHMRLEVRDGWFRLDVLASSYDDCSYCIAKSHEYLMAIIAAHGFAEARGFQVVMESFEADGAEQFFSWGDPAIRSHIASLSLPQGFAEMLVDASLKNFELSFAIQDLITAIRTSNYCEIASGRAVEVVRTQFPAPTEPAAWELMRKHLNLTKEYLQFVTHKSQSPRHGRRLSSADGSGMEVMKRAWTVVCRYVEYARRGEGPLKEPEFMKL